MDEKALGRVTPIRYTASAGWSSLVARWAHNPKVAGSNPAPATTSLCISYKYNSCFEAGAQFPPFPVVPECPKANHFVPETHYKEIR